MGSHGDEDHGIRKEIMDSIKHSFETEQNNKQIEEQIKALSQRAADATRDSTNTVTVGVSGEEPVNTWNRHVYGFSTFEQRPDDPHGVTRVSLGFHPMIPNSRYFVFRGDVDNVRRLLVSALDALPRRK